MKVRTDYAEGPWALEGEYHIHNDLCILNEDGDPIAVLDRCCFWKGDMQRKYLDTDEAWQRIRNLIQHLIDCANRELEDQP